MWYLAVGSTLAKMDDEKLKLANKLFVHAAAKGGQSKIDRSKIQSIVMSLTGESSFTKEKMSHEAEAREWAKEARKKLSTFDARQRSVAMHAVKRFQATLDEGWCCVVDFDMFFAAVAIRDRPELADKPVAVGGPGMISTANYVARKWGVRSAMPGWIGQELCRRGPEFGMPSAELVFVKHDFEKYKKVAEVARNIFREYDPDFRSFSLDEAYLRLSDCDNFASAKNALSELRRRIAEATNLTVSGGLAPNFMLAKICADVEKPNGQFALDVDDVPGFLRSLPCRKVSGIGRVLEQKLDEGLGIETVGDLLDKMPEVYHCFPPKTREFLHRAALGCGSGFASGDQVGVKGVGHERTFAATCDKHALHNILSELCEAVAARLEHRSPYSDRDEEEQQQQEFLRPRKVSLKLKRDDFTISSRTASISSWSAPDLYAALAPILDRERCVDGNASKTRKFRLIGVRAFAFSHEKVTAAARNTAQQPTIADAFSRKIAPDRKRRRMEESTPSYSPPSADELDVSVLAQIPEHLRQEFGLVDKRKKPEPLFATTSTQPQPQRVDDGAVARLLDMGFEENDACRALVEHGGSVKDALESLLSV